MRRIKLYLDNAATTKVSKEVVKEMEKYFTEEYGNPSSLHELGENANKVLNKAREVIAKEIGAKAWEIIFTSGGTESDNLAIQGLARAYLKKKKIVVSSIEHSAVLETCEFLKTSGYEIIKIPVDCGGCVKIDVLHDVLNKHAKDVLVVSIIHVNNIIGTIQNIEEIGKICRKKEVLFHTDAVQSFGKLNIDVGKMNIDLLSASGHKIGGPKGVGCLYVREGVKISPVIFGGGQERGIRNGTENVPAIIGFAKALSLSKKINKENIRKLRDKLIANLEKIGGKINGSKKNRIYNNVHVSFSGIESDSLVVFLSQRGIYVSAGSACDSKKEKEDHVLRAIGVKDKDVLGSIRITLNENLSERDIEFVIKEIKRFPKPSLSHSKLMGYSARFQDGNL
ncbi:MAG: cysteine desulfurase family protein [Nanoarchaeota archaeon]|nr:cysteine desulfurase family protein [Nanoarchaeota archaeon]